MKRIHFLGPTGALILSALIAGAAAATPLVNGATIELRTFNDCPISTVTTTNDYPTLVEITDAMHPACIGFANLHSFSFSTDGGATPAVFLNAAHFRFGADVTISGAGTGEGGLRLSPWWSPYVDGRFMLNATTGEIACFGGRLPFYSFTVNHGITYTKGETVRLELEYEPNGLSAADPATILYRVVMGGTTYESPLLPFDSGNPAEDPPYGLWGMLNEGRAGGYFQVAANTGAPLTVTWANVEFVPLGTPCADAATLELRTFNDCPISVLTTVNAYPESVSVTDAMDAACIGFANLHSFSFSADGGATAAVFHNASRFAFGADVRMFGSGTGEGGLRLSPWWSPYVDGRFMLNATTGEIACFGGRLPFYSFTVNHGITYTKGETVRLELEYEPNGLSAADPATILYRVVMGGTTYESPLLPFDSGNPAEDPPYGLWGMLNEGRAGGYFQVAANTGAPLTVTWANLEFRSADCACEVDTEAPELTVTLSPDVLWPPNHGMADVHATVTASDDCDAAPTIALVFVTSDEPEDGLGDGNTTGDIRIDGPYDLGLRSERMGGGDGRVYTACYTATDAAGNTATTCATVSVPHDRGCRASLFADAEGTELVLFGGGGRDARAVDAGTLALGTGAFGRLPVGGAASYADRDGDGAEDAVYRLSAAEAAWIGEAERVEAGVYARWSGGGSGWLAVTGPTIVLGAGSPAPAVLSVTVAPNPASGSALLRCALPRGMPARLAVFDVAGREVGRLADGVLSAGEHAFRWTPSRSAGAGVYLYRLWTPDGTREGRFVVIR